MKIYAILTTLLVLFYLGACSQIDQKSSESDRPTPSQANPNGDSELALLMREMFEESYEMKKLLQEGKKLPSIKKFEKIHTAVATEPEKAASEEYQLFAKSYQQLLQNLENAKPEHRVESFNQVVTGCMNCHRALCPGPMVRIKKLYVKN